MDRMQPPSEPQHPGRERIEMRDTGTVAPFSVHFPSLAGAFCWLRSREQGSQDNSVFKDESSRAQGRQQSVESGWGRRRERASKE